MAAERKSPRRSEDSAGVKRSQEDLDPEQEYKLWKTVMLDKHNQLQFETQVDLNHERRQGTKTKKSWRK